jgi:hypothetical protein
MEDIFKGLLNGVINGFSGDKLKGLVSGLDGLFGGNFILLIVLVLVFLVLG